MNRLPAADSLEQGKLRIKRGKEHLKQVKKDEKDRAQTPEKRTGRPVRKGKNSSLVYAARHPQARDSTGLSCAGQAPEPPASAAGKGGRA